MAPSNNNNNNGMYIQQTYSFLSPETFETLVEGYINQLHIRKRNKALITQQLANDCLMVLTNPENTAIFNPKFRWWVRKHFVFTVVGDLRILLDKKNGKPVCVREQLYDKVCYFHHIIGHGGRDKTFAAITKSYSKVPAELVSLFTKNCQTCLGVRKYSKNKRPILNDTQYSQQQQQQQLACDTNGFSSSPSSAASATPQYHSQQQYQSMISGGEQGTITPISPLIHPSNSGFFGGSSAPQQLDSSYSQAQLIQLQQQQMQQMHNAAINAHHMSMTLDLSQMSLESNHVGGISSLSGLGQINTNQLHGSITALESSTSTALAKMALPSLTSYDPNSMTNALLSFSQLAQQTQYQSALNSMNSPSEQYDHEQMDAMGTSIASSSQYSPLLEEHYQSQYQHQYQQHQFQNNDYTTPSYATNDQQLQLQLQQQQQHQQEQFQSAYSAAMSLTSMPLLQQQPFQSQEYHHESSPLLSQNQMFQRQIQEEQQRFHQQQQQQLSVSTSFSTLSGSGSSTSLSSPSLSAVPSLSCSTTTQTSTVSPTPLLASVAHSNAFMNTHLHPAHALSSIVEHEQKSHLSAITDLVSASHDL